LCIAGDCVSVYSPPMNSDRPCFMVVVVDVVSLVGHAVSKYERDNRGSIATTVQEICGALTYFCGSYALMNRQNGLVVICSSSDSASVVYPLETGADASFVPVLHELAKDVCSSLERAVGKQVQLAQSATSAGKNSIAQALSMAMTTLNRHRDAQGRVLILQFERDKTRSYNAVMNSIFRSLFSELKSHYYLA
jgi:hypothetical protein